MHDDTGSGLGGLFFLIVVGLSIALYFIPAIVASRKGRRQATAIFVLNLFLGWTVLGWVGTLVWAFMEDRRERNY